MVKQMVQFMFQTINIQIIQTMKILLLFLLGQKKKSCIFDNLDRPKRLLTQEMFCEKCGAKMIKRRYWACQNKCVYFIQYLGYIK
ncbi:hypothetical protein BpHYR1_027136 [Brachionus plicatilis]|uniref:Uncharacterized protein n=1 Tax=Brachionus plicatilis TaxID=10195 RepID=A0A3M7PCC6_BRAPC|nr:hypothetical protein BpHYR1_027136 [Brachionus plicatilis]